MDILSVFKKKNKNEDIKKENTIDNNQDKNKKSIKDTIFSVKNLKFLILFIVLLLILKACTKKKPEEPLPEKDRVNNIHVGENGDSVTVNNGNIYDSSEYYYALNKGNIMIVPKLWEKEECEEEGYVLDRFNEKDGINTVTLNIIPEGEVISPSEKVKKELYDEIISVIRPEDNDPLINEGEQAAFLQFLKGYLDKNILEGDGKIIGNIKNMADGSSFDMKYLDFIVKADNSRNTKDTVINTGYGAVCDIGDEKDSIQFLFEDYENEGKEKNNNISANSISDNNEEKEESSNEVVETPSEENNTEKETEEFEELTEIIDDEVTDEDVTGEETSVESESEEIEEDIIEESEEDEGDNNTQNNNTEKNIYSSFTVEALKEASLSQENCNEFMEKTGVLSKLIERYEGFTDDKNKKAATFALSLKINAPYPEIHMGSKVYVTNTPAGTFSIKLSSNYTLEAGHSGAVLTFKDVTGSESKNKPIRLYSISDFDYIPDNSPLFFDDFKTVETKENIDYEIQSETIPVDNGFIKEYRALFETGIKDGKITGENVSYTVGYYIDIAGNGFYVKIPHKMERNDSYFTSPDENTSQAVKSMLLSIILNDEGTANIEETSEEEVPSEEISEESEEDIKIDYDDAVLSLINEEKEKGVSKDTKADDMLKLLSESSITNKTEKYGEIYNKALYLMTALGNPDYFAFYEYLSDEQDGIKHIEIPVKSGTFKPEYVIYCMDGKEYDIDGYLISAGHYNDKYTVKNENEPGKDIENPFTVTKNNKTRYSFYIHDEDGTIVGQCIYEK